LISQLVEIARLNNGHTAVKREPRDFVELINESAARWQSQNPAIPLTTEIQLPDPLFDMDPLQMRQVIQHLLTFAALRVTEGQVSLTARVNDQGLVVTAQSTGVKNANKMEMDTVMLGFITAALIKLHGGIMEPPLETDDGLRLSFSLPR
jgi:signal transduction histidine kinase